MEQLQKERIVDKEEAASLRGRQQLALEDMLQRQHILYADLRAGLEVAVIAATRAKVCQLVLGLVGVSVSFGLVG